MTDKQSPRNITLRVEPAVFNLTCLGFHMWAEDFLNAERLYATAARRGSFVAHFLCCQSIELGLERSRIMQPPARRLNSQPQNAATASAGGHSDTPHAA